MASETSAKILEQLLASIRLLPPVPQVAVLLFLFLVVTGLGYGFWAGIMGFLPRKRAREKKCIDHFRVIKLCGTIASDLCYAATKVKVKDGQPTKLFHLARRAILEGVVASLGEKGNERTRACIFLPRAENLVIDEAVGYSAEACENLALPINDSVAGEAFETGRIRYCEDRRKDPGYKDHPKRKRDYLSILCIPLKCGDAILGVLNIDALPAKAFTDTEIRALDGFASLAALSYVMERSASNHGNGLGQIATR